MSSTMTKTTAGIPSTFAMPISAGSASVAGQGCPKGHTILAAVVGAADARALATPVVRDRKFAGATGSIVSQAQAYFPGTSAWRPPSC